MEQSWIQALTGGIIIGIAVTLMLWWNGRLTGIAGIVYGVFARTPGDQLWRYFFILGLFAGGLSMAAINSEYFSTSLSFSLMELLVGGMLVGFGSVLGSGCTSGHGVCGISRLSKRSIVATLIFMTIGIGTVYIFRTLGAS